MFFISGDNIKDNILWSVTKENRATDHSRVVWGKEVEARGTHMNIMK